MDDSTRSIQSDEIVSVGDIFAFDCSTGDGIENGKGQIMGVILSFRFSFSVLFSNVQLKTMSDAQPATTQVEVEVKPTDANGK